MRLTYCVICPIFNESEYLTELFQFLSICQPQPEQIVLIDGGSTDKSLQIINDWQDKLQQIKIINNPERIVPYALNRAIPLCNSDIIVRIDAHTKYASDYFEKIIETFENVDADIVGGPTRTAFKDPFQEAVAYIFNTPLGMGNSSVHDINFSGYTDSVTYGAWKRNIFKTTGLFDVRFKRNQDDEFHYRARSMGFKIYQNTDIKLWYYPRNNFKGLFKQYFEYGLYKPMVLKKNKSGFSLRHIIPSLFFLYLMSLIMLLHFSWIIIIPLLLYFFLIMFFLVRASTSFTARLYISLVYPIVHIGYGIGFILGMKKTLR